MKSLRHFFFGIAGCVLLAGCSSLFQRQEATLIVNLSPGEYDRVNIWLSGKLLAKPRFSDVNDDAQYKGKGKHIFKHLLPGNYLVDLDPSYEDWASPCVGYTNVTLSPGMNSISVVVPTNHLTIAMTFPASPPAFSKMGKIPLRVERLGPDGVDPIYKQWLWVNKEAPWSGELKYLEEGTYRITSFSIDYKGGRQFTDVYRADATVDNNVFAEGKLLVNLKYIIEPSNPVAGTDQ